MRLLSNTALALTRQRLVALSSATDEEGQGRSQGLFWKALEGAGEWRLDPARSFTHLRHRWDGAASAGLTSERQVSLRVEDPAAFPALHVHASIADLTPHWWTEGASIYRPLSPTRLETLARCPFRVFSERGLRLSSWKPGQRTALDVGTMAHDLMQRMLGGLEGSPHWPDAFKERHALSRTDAWTLESLLTQRWEEDSAAILSALRETPSPREREAAQACGGRPDSGPRRVLAWDLAQQLPQRGTRAVGN